MSTAHLAQRLAAAGAALRVLDTNGGNAGPLAAWRRILRHLNAAVACALAPPETPLYLSVNANAGMALTALIAALGRLRRLRLVLHHHTYGQILASNRLMRLLSFCAGPAATHLCICPDMAAALEASHPGVRATLALSNVGVVDPALLAIPHRAARDSFVLGHLSNLTEDKGVLRVLETFRRARAAGLAGRLILAGPTSDAASAEAVTRARHEFASDFEYRGAVYGEDKVRFYSDIDAFLFPSLYRNETQGIVNLESLAAGVPVVAFGLCCIPSDLAGEGCCVVPPAEDFAAAAVAFLEQIRPAWAAASCAARKRFRLLQAGNEGEFRALLARLSDERAERCN